jgi:DNA-binding NtrC family response regulator
MRLLVVGQLNGQLASAVKMAMAQGAKVSHVETIAAATHALRAGQGADLLLVDYNLDIAALIAANEAERIRVPVVACGVDSDARKAADAIRAGAKEFIPLPPDAEMIAAVLAAVSSDDRRGPGHAGGHRHGGAGGALGGLDPHHRRERLRQGDRRPPRPPEVPPEQQALHLGELRRHP